MREKDFVIEYAIREDYSWKVNAESGGAASRVGYPAMSFQRLHSTLLQYADMLIWKWYTTAQRQRGTSLNPHEAHIQRLGQNIRSIKVALVLLFFSG